MENEIRMIEALNINKTIQNGEERLHILNNINLNISSGEAVAIVGPSGSGKTTLLSLLAGLDDPTSGTIKFFGKELQSLNEEERAALRKQHIGFVFQSFQLISSLTALENVMLPIELAKLPNPETVAATWLEKVKLSSRAHHYPSQLSGGEQQRVAIARAFATSADCIFADEPTGNLDKASAQNITELLFSLNKDHKTTLLIVTHDERLAGHCHRKLILDGGKVC